MTASERMRMREVAGVIVSADRDLFDRATAEDFGAWEVEVEGPGVTYWMEDLDAMEAARGDAR